jgi:hypothetical protein
MRLLAITAALALLATPALAQGNKTGFSSETDAGQGNLGNDNVKNNPGTTSTTTSGPPGQISQGNTDCNNCTTTTDAPGNAR